MADKLNVTHRYLQPQGKPPLVRAYNRNVGNGFAQVISAYLAVIFPDIVVKAGNISLFFIKVVAVNAGIICRGYCGDQRFLYKFPVDKDKNLS